jgi:AcrR family transcriptional regulator
MAWQRARQPEQKEQRRQAIMEAAALLFKERDYDDVSLNAIAQQAGMAKSNLYRYFESKEEIFLHLFLSDLEEWIEELVPLLEKHAGRNNPHSVAELVVNSSAKRLRLTDLTALLSGVLEKNLSMDVAVAFKTSANEILPKLQAAIHKTLPAIDMDQAALVVRYFHALWAGLWPMANPSTALQEALKRPELAHMKMDFQADMTHALEIMLRGFMKSAK